MKSGVVSLQKAVEALDLKTLIGSPKQSVEGTSPPSETLPADDAATATKAAEEIAAALSRMAATIQRLDRELETERAARLQLQYTVTLWEQQYQSEQEANEISGDADAHGPAAHEDEPQRRPQYFQTQSPAGRDAGWSEWKELEVQPPAPGIPPAVDYPCRSELLVAGPVGGRESLDRQWRRLGWPACFSMS